MHVDVQLYEGRSLDIVTQAETIGPYGTASPPTTPRYTAGTAMLETAERLTETEREPALQLFLLLVGGLRTLAEGKRDAGLVLDAFLLRALAVAGWAPSFDRLRPLRRARAAPRARHRRRGSGLLPVPPGRRGRTPPGDVDAARRPALRRLGGRGRERGPPAARRRAASSPPTCSGTSSAGALAAARRAGGALVAIRRRRPVTPESSHVVVPPPLHPSGARPPAIPAELVPRHVASSWTATAGGPTRAACRGRGPRGRARRRSSTSAPGRSTSASGTSRRTRSRPRTGGGRRRRSGSCMGFNRDVIRRRRDLLNAWGCGSAGPDADRGCGAASSPSSRPPRR